jgi:hypothetical protein
MAWSLRLGGAIAAAFVAAGPATQAAERGAGTVPFVLDGNRIYAELAFITPDGGRRMALAYVDMGSPGMNLAAPLYATLKLDAAHPVTFDAGGLTVVVPAGQVEDTHAPVTRRLGGEAVEAMLSAGVLKDFVVVIDYGARTLTLARPGVVRGQGVATPFRLNPQTGLIAVEATIDGHPYVLTIDNGSAWTWVRQTEAKAWVADHPGWARADGAVGPANMMMVGDLEAHGLLVRVPEVRLGALTLSDVDALGPGPTTAFPFELFDWYSKKNPEPVLGWIGGNVLKSYRLTIDYPNRTLYWMRQAPPDAGELDRIGLTLRAERGEYFVAGVACKNGRHTVDGVHPGDKLVAVDGQPLKGASFGQVFAAMRGPPASRHSLTLERDGHEMVIAARATAF